MRPSSWPKCSRATRSDVGIYRWCELSIRADFDIPELAPATSAGDEWRVTLHAGAAPDRANRVWFHRWAFPDGREWVAFARDAGGYLLRFPGLADFDIVPASHTIGCHPHADAPHHTLRHLLLDQILPLVAGGRDRLALHGSAVATGRGAVVILGGPGEGKSTLAACLARKGHALVTDDCCLLVRRGNGFEVVPSYPGVRLAPDSVAELFGAGTPGAASVAHYTPKVRVGAGGATDLPCQRTRVPVAKIYVIDATDELVPVAGVSIERRGRRAALFDVLNYTFHLDVGDPARIRETFGLAADVATTYAISRLRFPWKLEDVASVAEAILGDLQAGA